MFETEEQEQKTAEEQPKFNYQEKLMETRTLLIFGEIDQKMAERVTQQLLLLSAISQDDIKIIINSQGGHVESGDTIFDMIRFVTPKVKIIGTGWVASAGALIYAATPVKQRYSLPNTRFLLHQPLGGIRGSAQDLAIEAKEILKMRRRLNEIFAQQTGQPLEKIERETDRNLWMSAEEAKDYGLVGHIVKRFDEV
ncbi:MAG TPA: ATP-dependent Clp protease proteolytic subunit [Anaerolineaceae bacterium]|nr:MAG: ATP-dependent Clp protease proteolytic subunit [Chloroflexi bacterium GWB2_54_36]HAL17302.1 ATP-dependent Clp protease proteolytic subunit [Anaerolineaceae bacterium]HBA91764.1 ATP-dependent Clp protease proteolytic subunit [Anaerolineaceae bacterium]